MKRWSGLRNLGLATGLLTATALVAQSGSLEDFFLVSDGFKYVDSDFSEEGRLEIEVVGSSKVDVRVSDIVGSDTERYRSRVRVATPTPAALPVVPTDRQFEPVGSTAGSLEITEITEEGVTGTFLGQEFSAEAVEID